MEKNNVIFDLDGTLCNVTARLNFVTATPPDFRAFDAACVGDTPNVWATEILTALAARGYRIWLISGRSQLFLNETKEWLRNNSLPYHQLLLRPEGEKMPDYQLKKRLVLRYELPATTLCAFEDSERVIDMYESIGIPTLRMPNNRSGE